MADTHKKSEKKTKTGPVKAKAKAPGKIKVSGKITAPGNGKAIGKVTHFYDQISVAAILVEGKLQQGDLVKIGRHDQFVEQTVNSLQLEHETIKAAKRGQEVGLKVVRPVREGDLVVKV